MQLLSPHILLLGCPYNGLETLSAALGTQPGWQHLGELGLTATETVQELRELLQVSQEAPPEALLAALTLLLPHSADPLAASSTLSTRALLQQLINAAQPRRSVLLETHGGLRLQTLERWLQLSAPLLYVHVVEPPETFAAAAQAALRERLFVAPDYRSHHGPYPRLEPRLAWYRIHCNLEILRAGLPPAQQRRVTRAKLDHALAQHGAAGLLAALETAHPAPNLPALPADAQGLAAFYGL